VDDEDALSFSSLAGEGGAELDDSLGEAGSDEGTGFQGMSTSIFEEVVGDTQEEKIDPLSDGLQLDDGGEGVIAEPVTHRISNVNVALLPVPERQHLEEPGIVSRAHKVVDAGGMALSVYGILRSAPAIEQIQNLLRIERQNRSGVERYFDAMYRNIGQAWVAAGCPEHLGVQLPAEVEKKEDPLVRERKVERLKRDRDILERMFDKRIGSLDRELQAIHERLDPAVQEKALIEDALGRLRLEGVAAAREILDAMPDEMVRDIYGGGVDALQEALQKRRDLLTEDEERFSERLRRTEADLEEQKAELRRQESDIMTEIGTIQRENATQHIVLEQHLQGIGEQLSSRGDVFANGVDVVASLERAESMRQEVMVRVTRLEQTEAALLKAALPEAAQRAIVGLLILAIIGVLGGFLWSLRPEGRAEARTITTWTLPESVDLFGEIRYAHLGNYAPLSSLVSSLQTAMTDYPGGLMVLDGELDLYSLPIIGFAAVLKERRAFAVVPGNWDRDSVVSGWKDRGLDPTPLTFVGRRMEYIDELQALYFRSRREMWMGDPDLMRDVFHTIDESTTSLENDETVYALEGFLDPAPNACLWFVARDLAFSGMPNRFLHKLRVGSEATGLGVEIICTEPFLARIWFHFGTGESMKMLADRIRDGLTKGSSAMIPGGFVAKTLLSGLKIEPKRDLVLVELRVPASEVPAALHLLSAATK